MGKAAKLASNNGTQAKKIVRQCVILKDGDGYVALDRARSKKVSAGATEEICRKNATFRHAYEVIG